MDIKTRKGIDIVSFSAEERRKFDFVLDSIAAPGSRKCDEPLKGEFEKLRDAMTAVRKYVVPEKVADGQTELPFDADDPTDMEALNEKEKAAANTLDAADQHVEPLSEVTTCKSCKAEIVYLKTQAGKVMPVDASTVKAGDTHFNLDRGHVSHFSSCPNAKSHRKPKEPAT